MSDYWKKKLEELNKKKEITPSEDYWGSKMTELEKEEQRKADVAPVVDSSTGGDIAPVKEEKETVLGGVLKGFLTDKAKSKLSDGIAAEGEERQKWYEGWFKKGNDDAGKAVKGTAADAGTDFFSGLLGIGEGIVDAFAWLGATLSESTMNEAAQGQLLYSAVTGKETDGILERNQAVLEQVKEETDKFIAKDLYDEAEVAKQILSGIGSAQYMSSVSNEALYMTPEELAAAQQTAKQMQEDAYKYLDTEMEADSVLDTKSDSLLQSAGQLAGTAAAQAVGVPWWLTTGATTFGSEAENALQNGATHGEAGFSAAISAGAEILTERIAGISFGGKTIGDVVAKKLGSSITNKFARAALSLGIDAAGEGFEEWITEDISRFGQWLSYRNDEELAELLFSEEAMDAKIEAFIGGFALGGGSNVVGNVKSYAIGVDPVTGLTTNEQKVVDKVYQDKIAEAEKDGKKLSGKEKSKIYDSVLNDFEKGYISTDTIESVLGGDSYTAYQDAIAQEKALQDEYDTLYKMKNGEKSDEQIDRQAELKKQLDELKTTSKLDSLRQQLDANVNLKQNGRLAESYNERARRGQAFEADLTKYDAKQQKVIQKAIDSGILNNTNRTHEFVDMVAKISADKGVSFDFTNNARLKESGFAVDGAMVNGYVTKDGVTVNIQAAKSLNSVVGHEITHVLEGTEVYTELQNALFAYSKAKGDYKSRLSALTKMYANVKDADVKAELTADLVGDYLFTDADFVNQLSVKHRNVFQKIYDEIKYLYKVATAGSQEARELERVKKVFDQAYKQTGKATGEAKYSLSETTNGDLVAVVDNDILSHLDTSSWDSTKKAEAKAAAVDALKQFSGGIVVDGITRKVNRTSRKEYTRSNDTERLFRKNPDVFADKMRAAEVADDIVVAATNWSRDGGLKHPRTDNFVDFDHGTTLIASGDAKYRAEVVVGITDTGDAVFYDVVDMEPAVFDIKTEESSTTATTQNAIGDIQEDSSGKNIAQNGKNVNTKFSLSDNTGKQLTQEQADFFKDSQVRDADGNLLVVYHGTENGGYTIFNPKRSDDRISLFFTDNPDVAYTYSGSDAPIDTSKVKGRSEWARQRGKKEAGMYPVYLNITNPLVVDAQGSSWGNTLFNGEEMETREITRYAKKHGYDGVIFKNLYDIGGHFNPNANGEELLSTVYTAFDSNQVKSVDNLNPTSDKDIRYSLSDSNGRKLSNEQTEYFKDSKARDADGNLQVVYHGTRNADFTVFKRNVNFFTDSKEMADSYAPSGAMYEGYVNITKPFEIDASGEKWSRIPVDNATKSFLEQYGASVFKEGGKWRTTPADIASAIEEAVDNGELDYDGIIIRNVDDTGSYYKDSSEHLATDYIVFSSNQFKNTSNTTPTADPDIRYSLTEYTAEEKKAHNDAALEHFGKTYMWAETGYLLLDGTKLDMSGKHEGAPGGYRTVDHRDIADALGGDYGDDSYSGALVQFMSEGNIRIIPEMGGINLSVKPTEAQEKALAQYVQMHRGEVVLDIDDTNGYTVASVEYPIGTRSGKVLEDIRAYFENGTKPEYSISRPGETPKTYGNYNIRGEDVALETAPVREDVAPAEETVEEAAPIAPTVNEEIDRMVSALWDKEFELQGYRPNAEPGTDAEAQQRLSRLTDRDAPPEAEAPYYGDDKPMTADDPFLHREWDDRKTKAFTTDNPDAKPFFRAAAEMLAAYFAYTQPAERGFSDELYYDSGGEKGFYGWSRNAADDIHTLLDVYGLSYAQIAEGLDAIIHDTGKVNNKPAKTIELILNDRLLNGYKSWYSGEYVPPNQGYIEWLNGRQNAAEYAESAAALTDADAPPVEDIAPVAEMAQPTADTLTVEDVMPIADAPVAERSTAINPPPAQREPRMARATPTEQATAQILTDEPKAKKKPGAWSWVKEHVFDRGMVFENLALKTGNRELQARWNSIRRAEGIAQKLVGEGNAQVRSLKSMQEAVQKTGKTKSFYEYLYHLHNVDRMTLAERYEGAENKTVFGDAVTADVSREAAAKLEKANPEFKQYAQDVYKYNTYLRELLVDGGVISRETANLWAEMYPHYVPIRRAGDNGVNINVPLDSGKTGINAPIKRATGGNSDILPLFDTMAMRTMQTYKAISKNRFGVELKNTLGTVVESDATSVDEVLDSIDAQEELLQEGKNGQSPTFTVFEDGERVKFEITEEMYEAMKPSNFGYTNKTANFLSNIRRGVLTEYNPWFLMKNAIKDVQDILINSQHPAATYGAIPKAIYEMSTGGRLYQEYMDNGGDQNTYFDNETGKFTEENKALETAKKLFGLEAISKANNIVERLPRLAEYIASREAGRSVDVAMLDAARVTTNFAAGGDLTKMFNRNGFTFLNASVQGAVQQARNIREAKRNGLKGWAGLAARYLAAGLPALLLNHLLWDDDEEYAELSDYVKQNYYIVGKYGDGKFVRIPKGRATAVIQNAFEQMENLVTGNDEVDLKTFLDLAVENLAPSNPAENNLLAPIFDVMQNKTWYGEDLVPTRLQDVPAAEQYDESTDAISKWLGETTGTSPYKWNYLLDQYSGVIGDTFLPMLTPEAENGIDSVGGELIAPLADMFTTDSVMKNQNVSDFYDTVDKLAVKANSSKATDEDVLKYKYLNSVNAEMGELYKQKREIQNGNLSDAEKYEQVRDIQKQIDELAKASLDTYGNVTIQGGYATVGDRHYKWYEPGEDSEAEPGWQKISDKQLEKQEAVTSRLGITPSEYWSNKEEYDFAYDKPEKYAVAKAVGGYTAYRSYSSELYDIKADKDESGKTITGSRKEKVAEYINNLDADYGEKIILFKSEYNADDTYNYEIIEYLNGRNDISYEEMATILKELGFTVYDDGRITWD